MRLIFFTTIFIVAAVFVTMVNSKPSFNGPTPGCSDSGCHTHQANDVSAVPVGNLDIEVTLSGVQPGKKVAGELVDQNGNVVDFVDATNSNPFILTAPAPGSYLVNAGYKKPARHWDSTSVNIVTTGIEDQHFGNKPTSIQLFQNHPNPFNNETMIRFSLNEPAEVELSVFNINGQLVRTLMRSSLSPGVHSIRWDGRDNQGRISPSGVYLYELRSGNERLIKRLVLAK